MSKSINFSDTELKEIHKALHDKRRKYVEIKGKKQEIFEHCKLKQVKYKSVIFSKFVDDKISSDINATYVIRKTNFPSKWNVIHNNTVYPNKWGFRKAMKKNQLQSNA